MKLSKKITALLLAMLCLFSGTAVAVSAQETSESNYQNAIEMMAGLSIMQGYEDGTFRPEAPVTRAEYATLMLRVLGVPEDWSINESNFADVPESHWAHDAINYLAKLGYVDGYGDGNYGPDDSVSLQDAMKILLDILGYETLAIRMPYPTGYISQAVELGLTVSLPKNGYEKQALRGEIAQIIKNAIDVPVYLSKGATDTAVLFEKGDNFLKEFLGITITKGLVTANSVTSLSSEDYLGDGRLRIKENSTNAEILMHTGEVNADDFLGYRVQAFTKINNAGEPELLYIQKDENKYINLVISAEEYGSYADRTITYYTDPETKEKEYTAKILFSADVIYNGVYTVFDESLLASLPAGNIELIDSDKDSLYDIIKINVCKVTVVDRISLTADQIIDRYSALNNVIYDEDETDAKNQLIKYGVSLPMSVLEQNDVLEIYQSKNTTGRKVNRITVVDESIRGTIDSLSDDWITVGGKDYKLSKYFKDNRLKIGELPIGETVTFMLDSNGCVVAPETKKISTLQYGYLIGAMADEGLEESVKIRMYTEQGAIVDYLLASKIAMDSQSVSEPAQIMSNLRIAKYGSDTGQKNLNQLVRYQLNNNEEIKVLDTLSPDYQSDGATVDDTKLTQVFPETSGVYNRGGLNGYLSGGNTLIFQIPYDLEETEYYGILPEISENENTTYTLSGYDLAKSGIMGCIVTRTGSSGGGSGAEQDDPAYMLKKITTALNDEGDVVSKIHVINGRNGSAEEYFLTEKTSYTEFSSGTAIKDPLGKLGTSGAVPLRVGDVLRISKGDGNAYRVLRMFSVDHFKQNVNRVAKATDTNKEFVWQFGHDGGANQSFEAIRRFVTARVLYKDAITAQVQYKNTDGTILEPYWTFTPNTRWNSKPNYVVFEEREDGNHIVRSGSFNDINDAEASGSKASYLVTWQRYGNINDVFVFNFLNDPFGN